MKSSVYEVGHSGIWPYNAGEWTFLALAKWNGLVAGCDKSRCLSVGRQGNYDVFFDIDEIDLSKASAIGIFGNEDSINRFISNVNSLRSELVDDALEIDRLLQKRPSDSALALQWVRTTELYTNVLAYYQLSNAEFSELTWAFVAGAVSDHAFDTNEIMAVLTSDDLTAYDSFKELESWSRIARCWWESGRRCDVIEHLLGRHVNSFAHLGVKPRERAGTPWSEFARRLEILSGEDIEGLERKVVARQRRSISAHEVMHRTARVLGLDVERQTIARSLGRIAHHRLLLLESSLFHGRSREPLRQRSYEIIRRNIQDDISDHLLDQLTTVEMVNALGSDTRPSIDDLSARYELSITELIGREVTLKSGSEAQVRIAELGLSDPRGVFDKSLSGLTVSGEGTVVGSAMVMAPDRISGANLLRPPISGPPPIIVATMVRPDMIPMCAHAGALITEEGGYTSHASVLSRELSIPCIVGVRNATSIIASGDNLSVNFDTGLISKREDEWGSVERAYHREKSGSVNAEDSGNSIMDHKELHYSVTNRVVGQDTHMVSDSMVSLASRDSACAELVGGKAAALHVVHEFTPTGFVIPINVLSAITADSIFSTTRSAEPSTEEDSYQIVSEAGIKRLDILVEKLLSDIASDQVAVRSSHLSEGESSSSYSGVFQSLTSVNGSDPTAVAQAVAEVLRSGRNPTVAEYARISGATHRPSAMAVIVQRMINADVSGTANTCVRRHGFDWFVVEYVYGALAPLVSGELTPQRCWIRRDRLADAQSTDDITNLIVPQNLPVDAGQYVTENLYKMLLEAEDRFGVAVDVEWAIDAKQRPWILQVGNS